jgi:WD40 repeat protein
LHRRGINSLAVASQSPNESYVFSASRDRLIKLWHVDHFSGNSKLITDLDSHTDWVNQIILVPEARNTLVSCSNDTTVKIWCLDSLNKIKDKRTKPVSTLDDHEDSVRCIDYSKQAGRLFSAADDG